MPPNSGELICEVSMKILRLVQLTIRKDILNTDHIDTSLFQGNVVPIYTFEAIGKLAVE